MAKPVEFASIVDLHFHFHLDLFAMTDSLNLPEGVRRVAAELRRLQHPHPPVMLPDAARTAQQAADGLGVALGQIAKSIIFKRKPDGAAVLVITAGDQRVDEARVQPLVCGVGQHLGRANAEFVKASTGFSIGGVSPVAHASPPVVLIDQTLFRFERIWAAAGHPHAVFPLTPHDLVAWTQAAVADVVVGNAAAHPWRSLAQATRLAKPGVTVPSPCVGICKMDTHPAWCQGCHRSIDEIKAWSRMSDADKLALWPVLAQRHAMRHPSALSA